MDRHAHRYYRAAHFRTRALLSAQKLEKINREAEAASRAKDQFLAALSHELRTPLTPVLLTATALESEALLPEAFRPQIALIRRNVELEARLIDDLLDLTRISRGKLQLHVRAIDPAQSLEAALEVCADELRGKGLKLTTRHAAGYWNVQADAAPAADFLEPHQKRGEIHPARRGNLH